MTSIVYDFYIKQMQNKKKMHCFASLHLPSLNRLEETVFGSGDESPRKKTKTSALESARWLPVVPTRALGKKRLKQSSLFVDVVLSIFLSHFFFTVCSLLVFVGSSGLEGLYGLQWF